MFKYKLSEAEPSTEGEMSDVIIDLIGVGVIALIVGALAWWNSSDDDDAGDDDEDEEEDSVDEDEMNGFVKRLPKDKFLKGFEALTKLSDDKFEEILKLKTDLTPAKVDTEIKLNKSIRADWKKVDSIRQSMLRLNPKDVAEDKDSFKKLDLQVPGNTKEVELYYPKNTSSIFYGVLAKYEKLIDTVTAKTESKTMKEQGWTKSNVHLLRDHVVQFIYTGLVFRKTVNAKNKKFYDDTTKFLIKMFPYVDWFNGADPKDPADIKEELLHIEQDEGVVMYAFGQSTSWVIERPFNDCVTTPYLSTTRLIETMFKKVVKK